MSNKKIILGLILITAIILSGCAGSESNYVIRVTANPDLDFSGSYTVVSSGQGTSKSVDGSGAGPAKPTEYAVTGSIVSAAFQKKGTGGILVVEILKNNKVVASSSTEAAYGVVTVSAD